MSTAQVFTLHWGIVATGNMAKQFVEDLLVDPKTRGVEDIKHVVRAVTSSSSVDRAKTFIHDVIGADAEAVAYGSLDELVRDPEVDAVYISSPTSVHYANMVTCVEAKKPVLCEPASDLHLMHKRTRLTRTSVTINAAQTAHLIALSRANNTLLAEALWTRYFPITLHLQHLLHTQRVLGKLHRVTSDLSLDFAANLPNHSIRDPRAGGGALLAVGVYPLMWAMMVLFESPENGRTKSEVAAQMIMGEGEGEGSDVQTNVSMVFREIKATAVLSCSLLMKTPPGRSVFIQGEKGQITIPWASYRPESYTLELFKTKTNAASTETKEFPIPGKGLFYQADSVARAIRDGKTQVDEYPLEDSLAMMQVLDEIRAQGGLKYPSDLELV